MLPVSKELLNPLADVTCSLNAFLYGCKATTPCKVELKNAVKEQAEIYESRQQKARPMFSRTGYNVCRVLA